MEQDRERTNNDERWYLSFDSPTDSLPFALRNLEEAKAEAGSSGRVEGPFYLVPCSSDAKSNSCRRCGGAGERELPGGDLTACSACNGSGIENEQPYACVACAEPRVSYGMCERCSNAWGIGRREALQAAYHVANKAGASKEVTDAIIEIADRKSPTDPIATHGRTVARWSLGDMKVALGNVGGDLECPQCASIFFTGSGMTEHTCAHADEPLVNGRKPCPGCGEVANQRMRIKHKPDCPVMANPPHPSDLQKKRDEETQALLESHGFEVVAAPNEPTPQERSSGRVDRKDGHLSERLAEPILPVGILRGFS